MSGLYILNTFFSYAKLNKRPRLNLLVPTINPSQSFGGTSTALKIFRDPEPFYELIADFRIAVTEAPTRPEASTQFNKYKFTALSVHDTDQRHEIVDALETPNSSSSMRA